MQISSSTTGRIIFELKEKLKYSKTNLNLRIETGGKKIIQKNLYHNNF